MRATHWQAYGQQLRPLDLMQTRFYPAPNVLIAKCLVVVPGLKKPISVAS